MPGHVAAAVHHRQEAGRQAGVEQHLGQLAGGDGRVGGRLEDDGVARRERRGDLVRHRVERRVEGRDRRHHAKRDAQREGQAPLLLRRALDGDDLARQAARLLARQLERLNGAAQLAASVGRREARLGLHGRNKVGRPRLQQGRRALQNGAALVRRRRAAAEGGVGGGHHLGHLALAGGVDGGERGEPVLVQHGDGGALARRPAAADQQRVGLSACSLAASPIAHDAVLSRGCFAPSRSQPENALAVVQVVEQCVRRAFVEDRAALQREHAVGERQNQIEVVLDDQDRNVLAQLVEYA